MYFVYYLVRVWAKTISNEMDVRCHVNTNKCWLLSKQIIDSNSCGRLNNYFVMMRGKKRQIFGFGSLMMFLYNNICFIIVVLVAKCIRIKIIISLYIWCVCVCKVFIYSILLLCCYIS